MGIPTIDQNYGKRSRADALIEQNSEVHASNIPIPPRKTLTITQKIYQCKFNGALVVESRGDTEENFVDIANETRLLLCLYNVKLVNLIIGWKAGEECKTIFKK